MGQRCFAWPVLLLAGAAHAAAAPEPPPEAVIATLPFAPGQEGNRVMLDLAPEGSRPFVMMLDTGASDSVITPGMARQLGVRVRRTKDTPYRRATRLGRDLQFWIDTRSSDTASRTGWEYGLLGATFLDDYVLEIDFPGKTVRFLDPKRYELPAQVDAADERVATLKMSSSRPLVSIRVNGKPLEVMLDTGDPGTGTLSGKATREVGIEAKALPYFGESGTVLGPMQTHLLEESSFGLAGFSLGEVALLVAPKGWYNQVGPNDSTIGYDVLAPFVIRIDYARKRLWLRRVESGPIRFNGADYGLAKQTGAFMTTLPGAHLVWAVTAGSPAAKLGVRVGDMIVSSESVEDRALAPDEVLRRILEGKELLVARKQGEVWMDTLLPEEPLSD
jgi:predicted aspartyl protease